MKSTYYHSQNYFEKFHRVITEISKLHRPLVENTFHDGLQDSTTMADLALGSPNKFLNNLFSFFMCVDGGDFDFRRLKDFFLSAESNLLPNMSVLLNKGVVLYARQEQKEFKFHKYPNEVPDSSHDWCFVEGTATEGGSVEGTHLATLYAALIEHLSNAHLDPPSAYRYTSKMSVFRRSSLIWAKARN